MPDGEINPRILPANVEAEQSLLGAIFLNNGAFDRVCDFLRAEHFSEGVHGRIYEAIAALIERGSTANPVTLKAYFEHDGALVDIGGAQYLARLAASAVTIINAQDYGRTIVDLWKRRHAIFAAEELIEQAAAPEIDMDAGAMLEAHEERIFAIAERVTDRRGPVKIASSVREAIRVAEAVHKANGAVMGVPTGFLDIDRHMGGLHPTDLIVLAGRPSMGKTALATNILVNAAKQGHPGAFFSLEMSHDQLATRILAGESGVSAERQRTGPISAQEIARLIDAGAIVEQLPLTIDDTPAASVGQLRQRARRIKRRQGLSLIVVDYLQLLIGGKKTDNRVNEISAITRDLKNLAKDLEVPVLALSQLSRAVEMREDKRPVLSDLRDSGSIEQDADVVIFAFREEYYLSRSEPVRRPDESDDKFNDRLAIWTQRMADVRNVAEANCAKNRHGAIRSIKLRFNGDLTLFENLSTVGNDYGP